MAKRKNTSLQHEEIVRHFAERLRELRHFAGKTQAEVAREAFVTETYISRLESAQAAPGIDLVARLAHSLGTTISDLLPTEPPSDAVDMLQKQAKRLFDTILRGGDRSTYNLLNPFLALLAESVERHP